MSSSIRNSSYKLRKLYFHFLSQWMGYDSGDSFWTKWKFHLVQKLSPLSYPIHCEKKWKYSFLSVRSRMRTDTFRSFVYSCCCWVAPRQLWSSRPAFLRKATEGPGGPRGLPYKVVVYTSVLMRRVTGTFPLCGVQCVCLCQSGHVSYVSGCNLFL